MRLEKEYLDLACYNFSIAIDLTRNQGLFDKIKRRELRDNLSRESPTLLRRFAAKLQEKRRKVSFRQRAKEEGWYRSTKPKGPDEPLHLSEHSLGWWRGFLEGEMSIALRIESLRLAHEYRDLIAKASIIDIMRRGWLEAVAIWAFDFLANMPDDASDAIKYLLDERANNLQLRQRME